MEIEVDKMPRMAAREPSRSRADRLQTLASLQHGAVSRRQLAEVGFSRHNVDAMVRARWLHRVHPGVFAVGRRALGRHGRWMAAVLSGGPEAVLSHRSAASLHGIRRASSRLVEITVATDRARHVAGVTAYRCARLSSADRTVVDGIPCASVALTLLGLAAVAGPRQVERALDESEVLRLLDMAAVDDLLRRSAGRRGVASLRAVVTEHAIGSTLTRSELEERALALCRRAALPLPAVNEPVLCRPGVWHTVDFLWPAERVVLETDGHRFHRTARGIERDRRREADLVIAGHRVLRATWLQVEGEPARVGEMIRAALLAGGRGGRDAAHGGIRTTSA
ncbi:MAG TPA: type IV toxin-antitoxin system AbiEi family antitoxin domain-containing protein [Solirubrobacteraceae bacterium]|nr:type IV toxin-antitoxin system AbiEi family antitoxin domain-containing protein [Solirubrobacteraceae bacterium]